MSEPFATPPADSSRVADDGGNWRTMMQRWRDTLARLTDSKPVKVFRRIWYGKSLERPTYNIAGAIFLRMLGLVYLIAFVSLWTQVSGLVGEQGILPVGDFLDAVQKHFAAQDPPASTGKCGSRPCGWNASSNSWVPSILAT